MDKDHPYIPQRGRPRKSKEEESVSDVLKKSELERISSSEIKKNLGFGVDRSYSNIVYEPMTGQSQREYSDKIERSRNVIDFNQMNYNMNHNSSINNINNINNISNMNHPSMNNPNNINSNNINPNNINYKNMNYNPNINHPNNINHSNNINHPNNINTSNLNNPNINHSNINPLYSNPNIINNPNNMNHTSIVNNPNNINHTNNINNSNINHTSNNINHNNMSTSNNTNPLYTNPNINNNFINQNRISQNNLINNSSYNQMNNQMNTITNMTGNNSLYTSPIYNNNSINNQSLNNQRMNDYHLESLPNKFTGTSLGQTLSHLSNASTFDTDPNNLAYQNYSLWVNRKKRKNNPLLWQYINQSFVHPSKFSSVDYVQKRFLGTFTQPVVEKSNYQVLPLFLNSSSHSNEFDGIAKMFLEKTDKICYDNITVMQLKNLMKEFGLCHNGKKTELIERVKMTVERIRSKLRKDDKKEETVNDEEFSYF